MRLACTYHDVAFGTAPRRAARDRGVLRDGAPACCPWPWRSSCRRRTRRRLRTRFLTPGHRASASLLRAAPSPLGRGDEQPERRRGVRTAQPVPERRHGYLSGRWRST